MVKQAPTYLDYQASTPMDVSIARKLAEDMKAYYANPSSNNYYGWQARALIDQASADIARLINSQPAEIIYTSSATEANNLALLGFARAYRKKHKQKIHIITSNIEHNSVLAPLQQLEKENIAEVTYLAVGKDGIVEAESFKNAIKDNTVLTSIMLINNEVGALQPIDEIGDICQHNNIILHSDITQAFGKIEIDVQDLNISMASISGHKHYGPKGIGALYLKQGIDIEPIFYGGAQQNHLRPGTLPTPLISALGSVAIQTSTTIIDDGVHISKLYDHVLNQIQECKHLQLNGHEYKRWKGNMNITIKNVAPAIIKRKLSDFAFSFGAACSNGKSSHVLQAIGLNIKEIDSTIRIGFGRYTTRYEIDRFCFILKEMYNE